MTVGMQLFFNAVFQYTESDCQSSIRFTTALIFLKSFTQPEYELSLIGKHWVVWGLFCRRFVHFNFTHGFPKLYS